MKCATPYTYDPEHYPYITRNGNTVYRVKESKKCNQCDSIGVVYRSKMFDTWDLCMECINKAYGDVIVLNEETSDPVNQPAHYNNNGIETIDVIEAWGLDKDYYLGNAVKYISRAGKKNPGKFKEDIEKAIWYLKRRIHEQE